MKEESQSRPAAFIVIERDGEHTYRIQSDQLEHIGEKLRGRRRFSVFNSIILPALVAIATTIATGTFQYVSWLNSIRLQHASDVALRAASTYEKAAGAIGRRRYATLVFLPAVRDALATEVKAPVDTRPLALPSSPDLAVARPVADQDLVTQPSQLVLLDANLKKHRFESYYALLKDWNEFYDQLLTDIDYRLDRPIFAQLDGRARGAPVSLNDLRQIDCSNRTTSELQRLKLDHRSLKLRFAVIHYCFMQVHQIIDEHATSLKMKGQLRSSPNMLKDVQVRLGDIHSMANEFRCFALRRIDYYERQKERSIISHHTIMRRLYRTQQEEARRHLERTVERCVPDTLVASSQ